MDTNAEIDATIPFHHTHGRDAWTSGKLKPWMRCIKVKRVTCRWIALTKPSNSMCCIGLQAIIFWQDTKGLEVGKSPRSPGAIGFNFGALPLLMLYATHNFVRFGSKCLQHMGTHLFFLRNFDRGSDSD